MTWIYNNGTDFVHQSDKGFYVPLTDYTTVAILMLFLAFVTIMFVLAYYKEGRRLDRYRVKYGFDRELESREVDNPRNIDNMEKRFNKRTFKDQQEKKQ